MLKCAVGLSLRQDGTKITYLAMFLRISPIFCPTAHGVLPGGSVIRTRMSFFLLLFFLTAPLFCVAQDRAFAKSRFGVSALAGLNLAQIAGDGHHGYDYPGWAIGLEGTAYFNWRMDLGLGLMYERRGAKPPLGFSTSRTSVPWQQNTRVSLDYVVLGLWYNQHLYPDRVHFSRLTAHAALTYGYAFAIEVRQNDDGNPKNDYLPLVPLMSRNDLSLQLGLTYYFTPKFGFRLVHSFQLIPLYKSGQLPENIVPTLREFHLQFSFQYILAPSRSLLERRRTPPWVKSGNSFL